MIKLLHFGDMHLDSPFAGAGVSGGERLRAGLREIFGNIMKIAEDYDAVLVAGDLFDCGFTAPDTVSAVREAFKAYGKSVVVAPGNHDPYKSGSPWSLGEWPENVFIFREDRLNYFDISTAGGPVRVWGWAFTSDRLDRCPLSDGITPAAGALNVICAHGDLLSPISKYCPVTPGMLSGSGCEYAAFGHVHKAPEPSFCGRTLAAYCGCPEGRSWDEPGEGHVLGVSFTPGLPPEITKIPTWQHRYETVKLDVTGTGSDAEIVSLAGDIAADGERISLLVSLIGSVPPGFTPDTDKIAEDIAAGSGANVTVKDGTLPVFDAEYLENDATIRGELYRALYPKLISDNSEERKTAAQALRIGLLALDGNEF